MKGTNLNVMLFLLVTTSFLAGNNFQVKNNITRKQISTAPTISLNNDSIYTCKMHDSVVSDRPGKCPVCGMNLVKQMITPDQRKMIANKTFVKPKE